jgi:DNA-binding transcriptional ArsR family regulator
MCDHPQDHPATTKRMRGLQKLKGLAKALHGPARWEIVGIIGTGTATTDTIRDELDERGYDLTKSGVYYHLSELSDAGVIEVAGYVEEGRGAPTKEWTLRRETIEIDLVNPEEGDQ